MYAKHKVKDKSAGHRKHSQECNKIFSSKPIKFSYLLEYIKVHPDHIHGCCVDIIWEACIKFDHQWLIAHCPANRKRYHNVSIWLYVGLVATQHRLNLTMMFAMSCRKIILK